MLLKFNFKNFKSFKEEVCLDLTATKITEFSDRNFEIGNIKVLPIASIFGANASGKSNVMEAFKFMCDYIMMSLNFAGGQINPVIQFEVYFSMSEDKTEKIYQYGFVFRNNIIEEEWLYYRAKTSREKFKLVFYRGKNEDDFSGIEKSIVENIQISMQKETLVLTLGAKLNEELLSKIYLWFSKNMSLNYGDAAQNLLLSQFFSMNQNIVNEKVREDMTKYISSFDNAIIGINAKEREVNKVTKQKVLEITFKHQMNNCNSIFELPLQLESAGTQKMLSLYPFLKNAFENGSVIFIDELNSRLHPLLLRAIMQMFLNKDKNKNKAQLVFSSHDVWQLKSDILRRDEIWFTEKNSKGVSYLYSLSDFINDDGTKIRKDEDHQKNYILGKYGAIPNLKGFDGVFD